MGGRGGGERKRGEFKWIKQESLDTCHSGIFLLLNTVHLTFNLTLILFYYF